MAQSDSSEWEKNDRKIKNFQCPCGKSYLSYPALYTHIKQSHGGKAPGQIKRPDAHNRGRPKASGVTRIEQHNKAIQQVLKCDPIPGLITLIEGAQVSKNRQIRDIYSNEPVFKLIMNDRDKPFVPKYLQEDRIYDVKMGEGIILFFQQIENIIQDKNIYDEIIMLVVLLTEHIIEETEDQNVLTLGTIGLMPEFVNYFMIHDFKKPLQRLKLEKLWIFQNQNPIRVLNIFFKWMLYKKFTLTKVDINERYFHPQIEESESSSLQNFSNQELYKQNSNENENENENQAENENENDEQSDSQQKKQQSISQLNSELKAEIEKKFQEQGQGEYPLKRQKQFENIDSLEDLQNDKV